MKVKPYLVFNGNAEEAATCYATILNGKIDNLHRYGDCMPDTPDGYKNKIAHICLLFGGDAFGIADAEPGTETSFGCGNIITLHCDTEEQIRAIYEGLAEGGQVRCPLQTTFFAKQYADLTDRFGVAWCLIIE